jgi:hypothetical protein
MARGGESSGLKARTSRLAWWKPSFVFSPRYLYLGERDETMDRIYRARGLIGFVVILAVSWRYQGSQGISGALHDWAWSLAGTVLCVLVAGAAAGAALVAVTYPGRRRAAAWQLRWPAITFAALCVTCAAFLLPIVVTLAAAGNYTWWHDGWLKPVLAPWARDVKRYEWVYTLIGLALYPYLLRAVYLAATGLCRCADGHPLLPPLVAPLAAALAIRSLLTASGVVGMSQDLHVALLFGGPVSLALLSVVEIQRLRRYPQFPFRNGPPARGPVAWQASGDTPDSAAAAL